MSSKRKRAISVGIALTVAEAVVVARRRGSLFALDTVVRCTRGHLFTTIWIPGVSIKALRLGPWRIQRCPVGPHWTIVTPAHVAALSEKEREVASKRHDLRIP